MAYELSDEDRWALAYVASCATYYAREFGPAECGVCGVEPDKTPVFTERMSCGHNWSELVYSGKNRKKIEESK